MYRINLSIATTLIPHTWEWFEALEIENLLKSVDPTYVGMIRILARTISFTISWSHIRGNDSFHYEFEFVKFQLIPHTWEWFVSAFDSETFSNVDPTYVGMIRRTRYKYNAYSGWSHIRGNDSCTELCAIVFFMLIPHTWEWFRNAIRNNETWDVDPTYVGMIRPMRSTRRLVRGWSHIRGNDS